MNPDIRHQSIHNTSLRLKINRSILLDSDFNQLASSRVQTLPTSPSAYRLFTVKRFLRRKRFWRRGRELFESRQTCLTALLVWLSNRFPFVTNIKRYDVKAWLLDDIIAGLTIGIMHIPQGMGYALLATLPPVYGLYTSFFTPLVYFFFGTSKHISIGTIAVISVMTGDFLEKYVEYYQMNSTSISSYEKETLLVNGATSLAFGIGLIQISMSILNIGSLTRYLSTSMISGYTFGVSVHVLTSQLKTILGIDIQRNSGLFSVPKTYISLFANLEKTNLVTLAMSITSIVVLSVVKLWLNPKIVRHIRIPLPIDLIMVIVMTSVTHFFELDKMYAVEHIGTIPTGLPKPIIPSLVKLIPFTGDVVMMSIISISISISLAKIFANRMAYKIESNQELLAHGLSNIVGSLFQCYPSSASLSRSSLQVSVGGKTQVVVVISSTLLLMTLMFIGPLLWSVPTCCLASIIIVALKGMLANLTEFKQIWFFSPSDTIIWILTFMVTTFVGINIGLITGLFASFFAIILQIQSITAVRLAHLPGSELYADATRNDKCNEYEHVKIIQFKCNLYYINAEYFKQQVYIHSGFDPELFVATSKRLEDQIFQAEKKIQSKSPIFDYIRHFCTRCSDRKQVDTEMENEKVQSEINAWKQQLASLRASVSCSYLILDCTYWTLIDSAGADVLKELIEYYDRSGIRVIFVGMKSK